MGRAVRMYGAAGALLLPAILLLALSLQGRAALVALGDEVSRREEEIHRLEERKAELQIASGAGCDLEAVERMAVQELGMQKPRREQVLYGSVSLPDRVEIVGREPGWWQTWTERLEDKLRHVFSPESISCD